MYELLIGLLAGIGICHIVYLLYFHFCLLPRIEEKVSEIVKTASDKFTFNNLFKDNFYYK